MQKSIKISTNPIQYIALVILLSGSFTNAFIIESHTLNGDGTYTYTYLIDNSMGDFDIASWSLEFSLMPDWNPNDSLSLPGSGGITVPNSGWTALPGTPLSGVFSQDFVSLGPAFDIGIGETLGGFTFTSSFMPGGIAFFEFSTDGQSNSGSIVGPIPEPQTWQLFAIALLILFVYKQKCGKEIANTT